MFYMDVKVYKKEEVRQPQGSSYVLVPNVIDIIPEVVEAESSGDIRNGIWSLEQLQRVADVSIENGRLIINSDNVRYEDGNLYVTVTEEQLLGCEILDDDSKGLLEQECALATIWQKGLDPLDEDSGISWSETLLGETNVIQLMEQLTQAVQEVSLSVNVEFSTVTAKNGNEYLSYKLNMVG